MEVNAADVKKLRDRTGMQMMKCKAALIEAGGDMDKATDLLYTKNKDIRIKLADREATEGRIGVYHDAAKGVGAIVELRCESAPVAKTDLFIKLAEDLARQVAVEGTPADVATFLAKPFIDNPAQTVQDRIGELVGLMRENIKPARMHRLEGQVGHYVHHDGSVGVLLAVEGDKGDAQMLRDVCMHITAKSPLASVREELPQDRIDKETEIARARAVEEGKNKPANIIDKIAEGKLRSWMSDNVLLDQPFVKDESKTVGQLLSGAGVKFKKFVRYRVGDLS
jgi:elongation factor Ts